MSPNIVQVQKKTILEHRQDKTILDIWGFLFCVFDWKFSKARRRHKAYKAPHWAPPPNCDFFAGGSAPRPPFICWGLRPQTPAAEAENPKFFAGGSAPRPPLQPANSRKIKKSSRWRRFCLRRHRDDFLILIPLKLGVRISRSPNPKVMVKVGKSVYLLVARSPILLSYRQVEALVFTNILSYRSRPAVEPNTHALPGTGTSKHY